MSDTFRSAYRSPKISVFTPVFNRREYMEECLHSVLSQSFTDLEYVIGDNASFDGTSELLRRHASRDPRIRLVRHDKNLGMVNNADHLYSILRGEYAIMVSSDDLLLPGALERLNDALDTQPSAVLATSPTARIGPTGAPLAWQAAELYVDTNGKPALIDGTLLARSMISQFKNLVGCPPLYRRALAPFDRWCAVNAHIPSAGDMGLYICLLSQGHAVYLPEPTRAHRVHPHQYGEQNATKLEQISGIAQLVELAHEVGLLPDRETELDAAILLLATSAERLREFRLTGRLTSSAGLEGLGGRLAAAADRIAQLAS